MPTGNVSRRNKHSRDILEKTREVRMKELATHLADRLRPMCPDVKVQVEFIENQQNRRWLVKVSGEGFRTTKYFHTQLEAMECGLNNFFPRGLRGDKVRF